MRKCGAYGSRTRSAAGRADREGAAVLGPLVREPRRRQHERRDAERERGPGATRPDPVEREHEAEGGDEGQSPRPRQAREAGDGAGDRGRGDGRGAACERADDEVDGQGGKGCHQRLGVVHDGAADEHRRRGGEAEGAELRGRALGEERARGEEREHDDAERGGDREHLRAAIRLLDPEGALRRALDGSGDGEVERRVVPDVDLVGARQPVLERDDLGVARDVEGVVAAEPARLGEVPDREREERGDDGRDTDPERRGGPARRDRPGRRRPRAGGGHRANHA